MYSPSCGKRTEAKMFPSRPSRLIPSPSDSPGAVPSSASASKCCTGLGFKSVMIALFKIFRRLEIDADQVPDRIVVFGAIQTPDRDPARVGMVAVTLKNFGLNPDGD